MKLVEHKGYIIHRFNYHIFSKFDIYTHMHETEQKPF